jgi:hypothetical protein
VSLAGGAEGEELEAVDDFSASDDEGAYVMG